MSLGEVSQVSEGVYACLQPDGSWYINNTGFLAGRDGVISIDAAATERRTRLDGAARGAPVDVAGALADMVADNGGRPLSCHA